MTDTIRQLWNGNLDPIRYLGLNNKEIKQLETLMQRNEENLGKHLNEDEKEMLEKYHDCMSEYTALISEQAFCDGFCFGAKMVIEALGGVEQML